jgi:hypothetical protein
MQNVLNKNKNIQMVNIFEEVLFTIIIKLETPRDFDNIAVTKITLDNQQEELHNNFYDSESLFIVDIDLYDDYILHEGNKVSKGTCVISKNEVKNLLKNNMKIKLKKKIYFNIDIKVEQYFEILNKAFTIVNDNINEFDINTLIDPFTRHTNINGRLFVVDLILRDYYSILKNKIDKLELNGHVIYKVENTKIFFI